MCAGFSLLWFGWGPFFLEVVDSNKERKKSYKKIDISKMGEKATGDFVAVGRQICVCLAE